MDTHTTKTYASLQEAYTFFNTELFQGKLPEVLLTLQRKGKTLGYYANDRFKSKDGNTVVDELALNPDYFKNRDIRDILSTLVHEMVHVQQQYFYKAPRTGYHNKEWANLMRDAGLIASSTGQEGGKKTGQNMTHYIEAGGAYDVAVNKFLTTVHSFEDLLCDIWEKTTAKPKKESKVKYTCPSCNLNAWAKPCSCIVCGDCKIIMQS